MKSFRIIILLILFLAIKLHADGFAEKIVEARALLQEGYNSWDESKMQESLAQFERLLFLDKEKYLIHYYLALASYRLAIFYNQDKDKAGKMLDQAVDQLKKSQELNEQFPESYALLSSCYGQQIGMSPWKVMVLGVKSGNAIDRAVELGPENPRVWLAKAIGTNYTPKLFGGGKDKALEEIRKAIFFYEQGKQRDQILPCWGYDEAYAWFGIILKETGDPGQAKEMWEKGLEINPQNGWIKYQLLPQIEEETLKQ
jgi:tetratricopeptide (TPR) repeat protein